MVSRAGAGRVTHDKLVLGRLYVGLDTVDVGEWSVRLSTERGDRLEGNRLIKVNLI